ncbi:BQ2448_5709 [Microbotryum intermedium]|uniref:BQ2448_5709 protein n=1 Tax=Microbotryum intermedium TaxID=269621 RepID=A0A238F5D8_9BASI|nr:BQ2448_5709 [Microbotryum intermedium]
MSSFLAPPAVPAATARPRPPAIQPTSSRPAKTSALNLKYLLRLPIRIFSPPEASRMVGSVCSLRATPLNDGSTNTKKNGIFASRSSVVLRVIWLLGEDRQLLRYEAEPPTMLSNSIVDLGPATPRSSRSSWDEESSFGNEKDRSPEPSFTTQTSATPFPWEISDSSAGADSASSRPPSYVSKASTLNLVPSSAQVWGPVTKVFSPDVIRAQWRLAIGALLAGVVGLLTVGAVLMAVPNRA